MSELAPPPPARVRRGDRLDALRRLEQQIAMLTAQARLEVAALAVEDLGGLSQRYVSDELALLWRRSPRQARNRLDQAQMFAAFPAVHARIADGSWLIDHADAVLGELVGCGLDHAEQHRVLDLVLSRGSARTPWELRAAVRTAVVVLYPDHAARRAEQARHDRDVRVDHDAAGVAWLTAHGPAPAVAAMMASLDALCWPPAPEDTRSAAERRFDTLFALMCGHAQPGNWQVQLVLSLATLQGEDELPADLPGHGPIPAPMAREIAAGASLRRVVVDESGQLVAVDAQVHRPDLPAPVPAPRASAPAGWAPEPVEEAEPVEPDPDTPSEDDLRWLEHHTDRASIYAREDQARARRRRNASNDLAELADLPGAQPPDEDPSRTQPLVPPRWSSIAWARALHRIRTDPLSTLDLHTDTYGVPPRLKRHLVLRDRTCTFPGCPRRAQQCDSDHLIPWPRGSTSESNLASECEPHHQAKHQAFTVTRLVDGTLRWTTPTGHSYDRPPRPVLDAWTYRPPDLGFH